MNLLYQFYPSRMRFLILILVLLSGNLMSQPQIYTGINNCEIRMQGIHKEYVFESNHMEARLNTFQKRFEFIIPVETLKPVRDSSDLAMLNEIIGTEPTIILVAELPDDQIDFSEFKGNTPMTMNAQLFLGSFIKEDDLQFNEIQFNGIKIGDNNLEFNFDMFIQGGMVKLINTVRDDILEIEIIGKGNRIVGITSTP